MSSAEDIKKAYQAVCDVTKHQEYLIETYLVGDEFGAQAFVQDGKLEFVLPHGDYVFKGDTGVPVGTMRLMTCRSFRARSKRLLGGTGNGNRQLCH